MRAFPGPTHLNAAAGFERGIRGIANQIDQQLFQLIGVRGNSDVGTFQKADLYAGLERHASADPF